MTKNKVLQLLSLSMRAGKIASGEFKTEEAVKSGNAFLVVIADDASDNTKKKFTDMCSFYNVDSVILSNKEELGHYIGKEFRAMLAVTDKGLSDKIKSEINC